MATLELFATSPIDFVHGSTPRTINVYTVPTGYTLVLDSADTLTSSVSNPGSSVVLTLGNSGNSTAYEQTHLLNTYDYLYSYPPEKQTVTSGTTITATITSNSTASSETGYVTISGYLIPSTGSIPTPPTPPLPSTFIATFYTVDTSGSPVAGVSIEYALYVPPSGNGLAFDANPHTLTSDDTGLVEIPATPGATYKLWTALNAPVLVLIPSNASNPFVLPNWTTNS